MGLIETPFQKPVIRDESKARFADVSGLPGDNWCPILTATEDAPKQIPVDDAGNIGMTLAGTRTFFKCMGAKCAWWNAKAEKCIVVALAEKLA